MSRIQIDNRAKTYPEAKNLAAATKAALDNLSGLVGSTNIQTITVESLADIFEPPTDGDQQGIFNIAVELTAYHD